MVSVAKPELVLVLGEVSSVANVVNTKFLFCSLQNKKTEPNLGPSDVGQLLFYLCGALLTLMKDDSRTPFPMLGLFMEGPLV